MASSAQLPGSSRPTPVSASTLAGIEKQRRDVAKSLGACPSGCGDLDRYVLLGGLERGSVVGISAEEEDGVGVTLGLQILICSLLDKAVQKVQVVTPKPPGTIVVLLKNGITAELKARGVTELDEAAAQRRDCLDRIMLSRVFDMDGLCEVLADLESAAAELLLGESGADGAQQVQQTVTSKVQTDADAAVTSAPYEPQEPSVVAEIQDSQDEDEPLSPLPTPPQPGIHDEKQRKADEGENDDMPAINKAAADNHTPTSTTPDIILITHFSSLLTSFFTQRDKPTAHATLHLIASRLRRLSRTLPSHPLILLINSTDSGAAAHSSDSHGHEMAPSEQPSTHKYPPVDPTLRSIFNPASPSSVTSPSPHGLGYKPNKPTFGLVFTQLLDLHLLCTRAPRPSKTATAAAIPSRARTIVEVLLDDIGVWGGERGRRKRREQRWTVVASRNGRIIDASDGEKLRGTE
ncbi:hypothetical protein J3F83DRAFT_756046 [Trichoderma novae-zelandiae]